MSDAIAIALRPAILADAPLLRHWDKQPHVMAGKGTGDWGWETALAHPAPWREQLIAELNGHPTGFVQIIDPAKEEAHYWGDVPTNLRAIDIWIGEAAKLGKGYGTQMMQLTLAKCFADSQVTAVLIDPMATNVPAHRFYERLGFKFLEHRRFGDDDCAVYRLSRTHWVKARGRGRQN